MTTELMALISTAAIIALTHTMMGPDHFLPFVALGKARGWSRKKMAAITVGCGLGHAVGSVGLGAIGIWLGHQAQRYEIIEGFRGDLAAYCLLAFGLVYMAWGLKRAYKNKPHSHAHVHADGTVHTHDHNHHKDHAHVHEAPAGKASLAPWTIFIIFVLGPCEPLIPLMMAAHAEAAVFGATALVATYTLVTVATMTVIAIVVYKGLSFVPSEAISRFRHAMAGGTLAFCGYAIVGLGL